MRLRVARGDCPVDAQRVVQALHAVENVAVDEMDEFLLQISAFVSPRAFLQSADDVFDRGQSFFEAPGIPVGDGELVARQQIVRPLSDFFFTGFEIAAALARTIDVAVVMYGHETVFDARAQPLQRLLHELVNDPFEAHLRMATPQPDLRRRKPATGSGFLFRMRPGAGRPPDAVLLIGVIPGGEAIGLDSGLGVGNAALRQAEDQAVILRRDNFVAVEDEEPLASRFLQRPVAGGGEVPLPGNGHRPDVEMGIGLTLCRCGLSVCAR